VRSSAAILEFSLVVAVTLELMNEHGLTDFQMEPGDETVRARVRAASGIDPIDALKTLMAIVPDFGAAIAAIPDDIEIPTPPPFDDFVRATKTMLAACPIEKIDTNAIAVGQQEWGHRTRMAYDALKAFVRRHDPRFGRFLRDVGRLYADARLSLEEAAGLLGQGPSDAIALLEEHGYCRRADREILTGAERDEKLAAIRRDRLSRDGQPQGSRESVFRDTVASCRIENLDARRWLDRE
jgi:hypothetical protein